MKSSFVLDKNTTFEDAIKALDANGNGFLAVVDCESKLVGILTDGDIRRAILNKLTDLNAIINSNPVTLSHEVPKRQAIAFLKSIHRRHLPLVNAEHKLVDVLILDDIEFSAKQNRVMVMAGGYGTRLGNLTKDTPKPMLTIRNKPILEYILNHCYEHGFTNIYISVNYKSEVIKSYFKDGSHFGLNITYIEEKEKLGLEFVTMFFSFHKLFEEKKEKPSNYSIDLFKENLENTYGQTIEYLSENGLIIPIKFSIGKTDSKN